MSPFQFLSTLAVFGAASAVGASELNDYPTAARAEYIFACMKANGETRTSLNQCSCSIDIVASILPFDDYVRAEAVLSLAQEPGPMGSEFRTPQPSKDAVRQLRRAQAEGEVRCF